MSSMKRGLPRPPEKEKTLDLSSLDIKSIQAEVLRKVEDLQDEDIVVGTVQDGRFVGKDFFLEKEGELQKWRLTEMPMQAAMPPEVAEIGLHNDNGKILAIKGRVAPEWIYSAEVVIKSPNEFAWNKIIPSHICPVLKGISDDAFDVAKAATPVLITLAIAGTIALNPVMFALIAVFIARMGVRTFCADYINKQTN